jgi:hypothetical protein
MIQNEKPDASRGPDPAKSRLRTTVATMERELASMRTALKKSDGKGPHEALIASFDDLVQQLALGPEPELRNCPTCGGVCMRLATVCAACWTKLTPSA